MLYAAYLSALREVLAPAHVRLTAAVANWSPMLAAVSDEQQALEFVFRLLTSLLFVVAIVVVGQPCHSRLAPSRCRG